jgi:hypothetical protein
MVFIDCDLEMWDASRQVPVHHTDRIMRTGEHTMSTAVAPSDINIRRFVVVDLDNCARVA